MTLTRDTIKKTIKGVMVLLMGCILIQLGGGCMFMTTPAERLEKAKVKLAKAAEEVRKEGGDPLLGEIGLEFTTSKSNMGIYILYGCGAIMIVLGLACAATWQPKTGMGLAMAGVGCFGCGFAIEALHPIIGMVVPILAILAIVVGGAYIVLHKRRLVSKLIATVDHVKEHGTGDQEKLRIHNLQGSCKDTIDKIRKARKPKPKE